MMSLSYDDPSADRKVVHLPGLKEIAEYNGDVIMPGGDFGEDSEEARMKRLEAAAKEKVFAAESGL